MLRIAFVIIVGLSSTLVACQQGGEEQPSRIPALREQGSRLFPVARDGQWGFINQTGDVVIETQFDWAGEFTNGLALVRQDGLYGYVRRNGEVAIEPQFEDAWHFSEGLAPVQIDGRWGYIDEDGEIAVDPQFELPPSVLEEQDADDTDLVPAVNGDGYGFRRGNGEMDIDARFESAWYFSGGLARVRVDGLWGYINREGTMVIEPKFDRAWDFRDGLAMVEVDGGIGYINRSGEYVWEP